MSIEKCVSPIFKVREDLINGTETAWRNIIKGLTDLSLLFCPARYRHVLTDLSILRRPSCGCLKQDVQDEQDAQDERGLGAAQGSGCSDTSLQVR